MFSRKKSFFKRRGFYILIAGILAFGYVINYELSANNDELTANARTQSEIDSLRENDADEADFLEKNEVSHTSKSGLEEADQKGGYYLVKEHHGVIKVFYYDSNGNESVLSDTNIEYSLIAEDDQQLFRDGIIINTNEELQNLLENFES